MVLYSADGDMFHIACMLCFLLYIHNFINSRVTTMFAYLIWLLLHDTLKECGIQVWLAILRATSHMSQEL
jgi:hypothetical protein